MNDEIRRLEELVAHAAGAMAFPVLAEAHRRAGRPEEAERVARAGLEHAPEVTAGRVALALALLDQKRGDEAKRELERLLGGQTEHVLAEQTLAAQSPEGLAAAPHPFGEGEVADDELDTAFEEAESDRDQMLGADDVAHAALAAVSDEDDTDPGLVPAEPDAEAEALVVDPRGPFATETVATLLERQGHAQQAGRIRESLAADEAEEEAPAGGHAHRATLERWLDNLRRDRE